MTGPWIFASAALLAASVVLADRYEIQRIPNSGATWKLDRLTGELHICWAPFHSPASFSQVSDTGRFDDLLQDLEPSPGGTPPTPPVGRCYRMELR